jgi:hypothetical protein
MSKTVRWFYRLSTATLLFTYGLLDIFSSFQQIAAPCTSSSSSGLVGKGAQGNAVRGVGQKKKKVGRQSNKNRKARLRAALARTQDLEAENDAAWRTAEVQKAENCAVESKAKLLKIANEEMAVKHAKLKILYHREREEKLNILRLANSVLRK